jgi:hypothetical protein
MIKAAEARSQPGRWISGMAMKREEGDLRNEQGVE